MERQTKIVATTGPASQKKEILSQLIQAGVNIFRLNFSHGTHAQHLQVIRRIRVLAARLEKPITILQDLQGPKIRTGLVANGGVNLEAGDYILLTTRQVIGNRHQVSVDYPDLPACAAPGNRILIDDGKLELEILGITDTDVEARVILGGQLGSHKGVNLPGACLNLPGFTEKDRRDLEFGLKHEVDAIAISFVREADDVLKVRTVIQEIIGNQNNPLLIAKLERPEALDNLEEIIRVADGVMVARGDLGVEMSLDAVPIAQKRIIACANQQTKLVITATQMLDSMIHNPRPTRAEASDIANAIFDGTDAVMLSGETAVGQYPVKSVEMMNAIICQAEAHLAEWSHWSGLKPAPECRDDAVFITLAARELAQDRNVAAIAVFTKSGRTALLMSKSRPAVPILAFTPERRTYYRLGLYWGVTPYHVPHSETIEEMIQVVDAVMVASRRLQAGEQVVLVCGFPVHAVRPANLALLHTVGEGLPPKETPIASIE